MNMHLAIWDAFLNINQDNEYDIVDSCGFSAESLIPSLLSVCPVVARVHDRLPGFMEKELSIIGDSGFKFEKPWPILFSL